jgi:RNA polymerase sigma factor for flagellar operon FliA
MGSGKLTAEQQRWVERAAPRVRALARVLAPRMPHASVEELESAGLEGLVQAALRYDPNTGVPFRAFAHYRVRGAMIDAARDAAPAIRRRSRAMRVLEATQALLEQAQRRQPRPEDGDPRSLAQKVQVAADLVAQTTAAVVLSKLAPRNPDTVPAPGRDLESLLLDAEDRALVERLLEACNDDERALIDAIYFRGLTMAEFAGQIGRDKSTVSRHHARLLTRLGKRMRLVLAGLSKRRLADPPDS